MKTLSKFLRLVPSIVAILIAVLNSAYAQDIPVEQRNRLKKQLEFEKWEEITRTAPAGRIETFKIEDSVTSPWHVRRSQDIGSANRGTATQYILSRASDPKSAEEIIRVTIT